MTREEALKEFEQTVKWLEEDYLNLKKCLDLAKTGDFEAMAGYACYMDTCQRDKIPTELWPEDYL